MLLHTHMVLSVILGLTAAGMFLPMLSIRLLIKKTDWAMDTNP